MALQIQCQFTLSNKIENHFSKRSHWLLFLLLDYENGTKFCQLLKEETDCHNKTVSNESISNPVSSLSLH